MISELEEKRREEGRLKMKIQDEETKMKRGRRNTNTSRSLEELVHVGNALLLGDSDLDHGLLESRL